MENTKKGKQMTKYTIELVKIIEIIASDDAENFGEIITQDEKSWYVNGKGLDNVFVLSTDISVIDVGDLDD